MTHPPLSKTLFTGVGLLLLSTILHAEPEMTKMQRFYYDLGKKAGKVEFIKEGYRLATRDFQGIMTKYRKKIAAQQAAKYLIESGKITYPKIYKIRENGSYRIKIMAPIVEQEFSPEDLFIVPMLKNIENMSFGHSISPTIRTSKKRRTSSRKVTPKTVSLPSIGKSGKTPVENPNAFSLPDLNNYTKKRRPTTPRVVQKKTSLYVPYKSSTVENFLNIYGAKYTETKKGYKVHFSNQREKQKFCTELTGDGSCKNM